MYDVSLKSLKNIEVGYIKCVYQLDMLSKEKINEKYKHEKMGVNLSRSDASNG